MKFKKQRILIGLALFVLPVLVFANPAPCNGLDCDYCKRLMGWSGLFQFLFWISAVVTLGFLGLAGYFFYIKKDEEEAFQKAKNWLFYGIISASLTTIFFIPLYIVFQKSQSPQMSGFYGFKCGGNDNESQDKKTGLDEIDSSDDSGFLGTERPQGDSLSGGTRPNQSVGGRDNNYLQKLAESIISSGNLSGIVSGDNRIIKLDSSSVDPFNLISDIELVDPDGKIEFIVADKGTDPQKIIDFRNVNLGYDKNKTSQFLIKKDEVRILGDEVTIPNKEIQELFSVTSTDVPGYFVMDPGENFKTSFDSISGFKEGNLNQTMEQIFGSSAESIFGSKDVYAFSSGTSGLNTGACIDSGGEITQFHNQCFADREQYGDRSLECSNIYNPVSGCDCPDGYFVSSGACTKDNSSGSSQSNQELVAQFQAQNPAQLCSDINLSEKNCPPTRCEGNKLVYYPDSVKDECTDSQQGPVVVRKYCEPQASQDATENSRCSNVLSQVTPQAKMQEAKKDPDFFGKTSDWYDKILNDNYGKGSDANADSSGKSLGGSTDGSTGGDSLKDNQNSGPLPPDKGALSFNPTPQFKELKECIGLKDDQIPYNGVLVVLLNPVDPLNRRHKENISKMFYLSREGNIIGKNGDLNAEAGGQEYGARTFDKSWTGSPDGPSMWGRGWKLFKGPTKYDKNGWTDECSFGSHDGFKTGTSQKAMEVSNLKGGVVTRTVRCGQHVGDKNSSAGCATMGNKSRCGFINTAKSYMTKSDGTIMQINLVGSINSSNGKFESPDCGETDFCRAMRSFDLNAGAARKFRNDPNEGYDSGDKRRVDCQKF